MWIISCSFAFILVDKLWIARDSWASQLNWKSWNHWKSWSKREMTCTCRNKSSRSCVYKSALVDNSLGFDLKKKKKIRLNCERITKLKCVHITADWLAVMRKIWESPVSLWENHPPKLRQSRADGQVSLWTYPISLLTDKQPPVNVVSASRWEDGGSVCHTA